METMALNQKQKEYILNNFFEPWDFQNIFERSKQDLMSCAVEFSITKDADSLGWRNLYNVLWGEEYFKCKLNFKTYADKWEEILKLAY